MKHLLAFLFIGFSLAGFSQNLQFSRVVNLKGENSGGGSTAIDTVPVGKVWKVENFISSANGLNWRLDVGGGQFMGIAGGIVFGNTPSNNSSSSSNFGHPIWLAEGEVIYMNGSGYYFFSILEFDTNP